MRRRERSNVDARLLLDAVQNTLDRARQATFDRAYFDALFALNVFEMLRSLAALSPARFSQVGEIFDDWADTSAHADQLSARGQTCYAALKVVRAWRAERRPRILASSPPKGRTGPATFDRGRAETP
jgi:hypothetical protein